MEQIIIAVDPGREKCGIAVVHQGKGVLMQEVIATNRLTLVVQELLTTYEASVIVIGDRTSSQEAKTKLKQVTARGRDVEVVLVDEHRSTDQARKRYWQKNPPTGFMRLVPVTMQVPPQPVDDYVAVILAERYFDKI
jgi:RNase H-fold protein (predicted Holliday junction resolvase)